MKLFAYALSWLLLFQLGFAQTITNTDTVEIGKKASTSTKSLKFKKSGGTTDISVDHTTGDTRLNANKLYLGTGNNNLRVNGGFLEFSNNDSTFKKIGSGSGGATGGSNLLENPSFEDGEDGWTALAGSWTVETYTNGNDAGDGTKFARFVATAGGEKFCSDYYTITDSLGAGGMADFKYNQGDAAFIAYVEDVSSNKLYSQTLSDDNTSFKPVLTQAFTNVAAGSTQRFCIESTGAGTIDLDVVYAGSNKNISQVAQSKLAGESHFVATASATCTRTSTTLGALTCNAALPGPTIDYSSIGQWQTTDANLLEQTINNLPPGVYKATFFITNTQAASVSPAFAINDGTTTCYPVAGGSDTAQNSQGVVSCTFVYTSSGNRSFELYTASSSSTVTVKNELTTPDIGTKFQLEYYPSDAQSALNSEQSGWFVDANIGGANPSLGNVSVASYTEIVNASLDMVLNTGSATAKIPCSTTNPATGLTCSAGSEGLGVVFTPPYSGWFDVCAEFTSFLSQNANAISQTTFQLIQTANSAQTIVAEGKTRTGSGANIVSSNADVYFPNSNCGSFYFGDVSEKTIRLMYEQTVSGTIGDIRVYADRAAAAGQRDVRITVKPSTMNVARPVLTGDQVTAPGMAKPKDCTVAYGGAGFTLTNNVECTTGTCVEAYDNCGTATPPAFSSTGIYTGLAWASGTWANNSIISCTCQAYDDTPDTYRECNLRRPSGTMGLAVNGTGGYTATVVSTDGGTSVQNTYFAITCRGEGPQ